jgi:hypothetical protein
MADMRTIDGMEEKERQIVEDLCSYLQPTNGTENATKQAIENVADIYDTSPNAIRRMFYVHKNMTPESWVLYFRKLRGIGLDDDDEEGFSYLTRNGESRRQEEISRSRALVPVGPVIDVSRPRIKSAWEQFNELVREAKNATSPIHSSGD